MLYLRFARMGPAIMVGGCLLTNSTESLKVEVRQLQ